MPNLHDLWPLAICHHRALSISVRYEQVELVQISHVLPFCVSSSKSWTKADDFRASERYCQMVACGAQGRIAITSSLKILALPRYNPPVPHPPTSSHLGIDLECVCYDNPSVTVHNSKLERLHTVVYKIQTLCIALQCDTVSNAVCLTKKMQCNDDSTVKLKWGCSQLFGNFVSLATTFLIFQCSGQ